MDIEPGTSLEADKSNTEAACSKLKYKGDGTTCCIPTCGSNTKGNPKLSYYQIPTDKKLRKMWLHWIGRANFTPNNHHRVCSKHFVGGNKTCLHNVPTTGCIKKLNRFETALNFAKQLSVSSFLYTVCCPVSVHKVVFSLYLIFKDS